MAKTKSKRAADLLTGDLAVERWAIDKVIPYPKNARKIPDAAVDKVAASIQSYGWRQPIVVDTQGVIVIGHVRRLAALKLGLEFVPVHVAVGLTAAEIRALRLADNRTHDESMWDHRILKDELAAIGSLFTGFDALDLPTTGETETIFDQAVQLRPAREYVVVMCDDQVDFDALRAILGLKTVHRGGYVPGSACDDVGVERVIPASRLVEVINRRPGVPEWNIEGTPLGDKFQEHLGERTRVDRDPQ